MRHSLVARLAVAFALLSFAVLATVGTALYKAMERELVQRDDAALVTRVDQVRTLLQDVDLVSLIHQKPRLFSNMLGNREALLVLRFPGQEPLIEVNPGRSPIPDVMPLPVNGALTLDAVHHEPERDGIPFAVVAASVQVEGAPQALQIIAGRLMIERSHVLRAYRNQILAVASAAAFLLALLAWWVVRRGLQPLRQLSLQMAAIGVSSLSTRIEAPSAPHELQPLIQGFNAMLDRLERGFTQLGQVAADMAHDLRTPIANLLGQTEVALGQARESSYYQSMLASNLEELQRLSRMISNMLFLARAEHADNAIECKALSAAEELQRVAEYFEGLAEERALELHTRGAGEVWADSALLRRALANLLANALRYADAGSAIILVASRQAGATAISVENRGPTIAPQHLDRLFDRFYRADSSRAGSATSSGLGLSIVRSIMTLHGGQWHVSSNDGVTRFTLVFPVPPQLASTAAALSGAASPSMTNTALDGLDIA